MEKLRNISSRQRNLIKYNDHGDFNCGIFETSKQLRCLLFMLKVIFFLHVFMPIFLT